MFSYFQSETPKPDLEANQPGMEQESEDPMPEGLEAVTAAEKLALNNEIAVNMFQ